jgi:hypothetical protein
MVTSPNLHHREEVDAAYHDETDQKVGLSDRFANLVCDLLWQSS